MARAQSVSAQVEAATGKFSIDLRFITARSLSQAMRRTKSHEVYRQLLINAPTGKVGSNTNLSGYPTNLELIACPKRLFLAKVARQRFGCPSTHPLDLSTLQRLISRHRHSSCISRSLFESSLEGDES